jgi:hypothetical protein
MGSIRTFRLPFRHGWNNSHPATLKRQEDQVLHSRMERVTMLSTILIVIVILLLIGALPNWGYSRNWGYAPSGGLGLVVLILVILLLMGRI